MRALQMHYTSCRHGLSGQAGFQARARSEGLQPEERRDLESRSGYRPPRDAPSTPSPDEIGREFPVAFRGSILGSGRVALIKSCYTGRDYSGRWGNFFAHSLVLEDDPAELPSIWPIDLYEWTGWTQDLSEDGEGGNPPGPLPAVDLPEGAPGESFQLDALADFLREEPGRVELLARMGRAVLLGPESSRRVVIRATALDGLFWIAAVQKLFPPRHAWRISFSTYQDDPRGCARVNATTGATDFRLDEADRKYRFYVFDLIEGVSSEVPEAEDDYPAVAARWMAECPERHGELIRFMDHFGPRMPESALTSALDLFRFAHDEEFSCSDRRFAEAVKVASDWTTPEGRRQLLDTLAGSACRNGLGGPAEYGILVRFLAEGANGEEEASRRRVFDVWWSSVRRSWSEREEAPERIEELWRVVEPVFAGRSVEAAELLTAAVSRSLAEGLPSIPVATVLLRISLATLERAGESRPWGHETACALLDTLGRAGAQEAALLAVRSEGEALVAVTYRLLDTGLDGLGGWDSEAGRDFQGTVGRALGGVLAHVPAGRASEVRAKLAADERWDVLLGEWLGIIGGAHDLWNRYRDYRSRVLDVLPGYRDARESEIVESLLDRLGRGEARKQAAAWVEDGALDRFGDALAARCLALANEAVPLVPGEAESARLDRLAEAVSAAAERRSVELSPDRPFLYRSLKPLRARNAALDADLRKRLGEAVGELSASEARDYLGVALPLALERAENLADHRCVLGALVPRDTPGAAREGYGSFMRNRKPRFPPSLKAALRFWLRFDPSDPETRHLETLQKAAHDELVRVLAELPQRRFSRLRKDIRRDIAREPASSRWQDIEQAIERRQRNPLRKLVNVFRRRRGDRNG